MKLSKSVFLALVAAAGCSGKSGPAKPTAKITPDAIEMTTGDFVAPAGESFMCFYTTLTTDQAYMITGASATQGPGGHHILAYYVDTPRQPTAHICNDAEMLNWHIIAGSSGEAAGSAVQYMSDGEALEIPTGKQIVIQSHYINPLGHAETVNDSLSLTIGHGSSYVIANAFTLVDLNFDIPASQSWSHTTTCTVPQDLDLSVILGHMHQYGQHFTLEEQDPGQSTWTTRYDTDWVPAYSSHPPLLKYTLQAPLHLAQNTLLRMTCTWDNTTASPIAFPDEMCVTFAYYFPDVGQGEIDCVTQ